MDIFFEAAGKTNGPNVMPGAYLLKYQCLKRKKSPF